MLKITTSNTLSDAVNLGSRAISYEVYAIDKNTYRSSAYNSDIYKVYSDGSQDKNQMTVSTNMTSPLDQSHEANEDMPCHTTTTHAISMILDNQKENEYVGSATSDPTITIDLKQNLEDDSKYRNLIEVMKSKDYEYLGLHPILDANLQVNAIAINDKSLTFDFSDHLYVENNQEALDIFEMLSYVFCVGDIEKINLKIDGNDVSTLKNSTIPASCITNRLGINNFESTSNYLYKTVPVVV